jgi:SAM-dependent methyltransferase
LQDLLVCPATGEDLQRDESGSSLVSTDSGTVWPIVDGRPIFIPAGLAVVRHSDDHLSNPLPPEALDLFRNTEGPVLNLSAGGTDGRRANVIEAEYAIFRNTDVVADAHQLPFRDESFEAVVSLNAFEHYRDPRRAAQEIWRVLKPGGRLLLRTAFLQPIHEEPFHFFNCTRYGLEQWLANFEIDEIRVSENFNPIYSLSWLASDLDSGFAELSSAQSRAFQRVRVEELVEFWRKEASRNGRLAEMFSPLPAATQQRTAAGWHALARKPTS